MEGWVQRTSDLCANGTKSFYRAFEIEKSRGGKRKIFEPYPGLKDVQRWLLGNVLSKVKVSPAAKAYVQGASIKSNAKFHVNQNVLVRLDVRDFFHPSRLVSFISSFLNSVTPSSFLLFFLICAVWMAVYLKVRLPALRYPIYY